MINAHIDNKTRKTVYARDGYRCALCDSTQYIQIHHVVPRSQGGTNSPQNLITLCHACHGLCHGIEVYAGTERTPEDMNQYCVEYLADFYAPDWNPWKRHPLDGEP